MQTIFFLSKKNCCILPEILTCICFVFFTIANWMLTQLLRAQQEIQLTQAIHTNMLNVLMKRGSGGTLEKKPLPAGVIHVQDAAGFQRLEALLQAEDVATALVRNCFVIYVVV